MFTLSIEDPLYPERLREMYRPPSRLYGVGNLDLLKRPLLAVVGTRRSSPLSKMIAEKIIPDLVRSGFVIVSGLARGVDTLAHEMALRSGGDTIAILGSGLDQIYPAENHHLAKQISEKGLLLTEYAASIPPRPWHFPMRNRIIAGLTQGTWVLEAPLKSGALITADMALEEGREVFATPGSPLDEKYQGCNKLIREGGAKLVVQSLDILEEFGLDLPSSTNASSLSFSLSKEEDAILTLFSLGYPLHLDRLVEKSGEKVFRVAGLLSELCLKGVLEEVPGNHFLRRV